MEYLSYESRGSTSGQFSFENCQFDGPGALTDSTTVYNIEIDDGGNSGLFPYSVVMRNVTSQWAWNTNHTSNSSAAILLEGVTSFSCEGCHFENDNGIIKEVTSSVPHGNWGVSIRDSYIATSSINTSNGYIGSIDSGSSLDFEHNAVNSTPDNWFIGTPTYVTYFGITNQFGGGWQPVARIPFLTLSDQGACTMSGGACAAVNFARTYATPPQCFVTWNGAGTLTGVVKAVSSDTQITVTSSGGSDSAHMNWICFGN